MSEAAKRWAGEALYNIEEQLKILRSEMAQIDIDVPEVDEKVTAEMMCNLVLQSTEFNVFLMQCFMADL